MDRQRPWGTGLDRQQEEETWSRGRHGPGCGGKCHVSQVRHHSGCIPHGGGSPGRAAPDVPVGQHDQEDQWRRKCHFDHQGRQNEETTDRPQGSERERLRLRPTGESSEEGIHHDGSTGLRDRGITPPRQGSHRSLQDDQVEYREEAGGTNQLGKDSTGGETTPRQIHQRIRELPTEALCKDPCSASTARSLDTRPGPAGPRPRPAGTAREDTSRPSARTARVVH